MWRHPTFSAFMGKPIKKVAVLGGSGSFAIQNAKQSGADAYLNSRFEIPPVL